MMRRLESNADTAFYLQRATYYDAVSYDDSVYRVHDHLQQTPTDIPKYRIFLVDEYQDFNKLEVSFINLMSTRTPVIVAGDDDQALYVRVRGASPNFIRTLYASADFSVFELPFSMRCTEQTVGGLHQILTKASSIWFGAV